MREPLRFSGVMPANILPFKADLSIDEPSYRRHLRWLADTRGVTGIVANGHASEVSSLSREERKRSLAIALDEIAGRCPVIAGVYSDGTAEAVELTRDARAAGAAGVLVFPPTLFMWGAQTKPDMAIRHFSEVAGVGLPIIVFEYPPASGIGYAPDTLARLAQIPQVAGVKDWSNEIVAFERNLRALRATGRPVAMLSAFTMSLMATFLLGADGAISGMGSVAADLQAELFEACQKGDLEGARQINDRLDPLVRGARRRGVADVERDAQRVAAEQVDRLLGAVEIAGRDLPTLCREGKGSGAPDPPGGPRHQRARIPS